MSYLGKVKLLKEEIASAYSKAQFGCASDTAENLEKDGVSNPEVLDALKSVADSICQNEIDDKGLDLEISFRELLRENLNNTPTTDIAKEESTIFRLLKFAFSFAVRFHEQLGQSVIRIPYLMLEDTLEEQTIATAEAMWPLILKTLKDRITHKDLFAKGKLTMLRTCNSLLRKLSKSCNTEFCGRVLMFLAAIYPLSEKSALNLPGKINSNNVTYYESEQTYVHNWRVRQGLEVSQQASSDAAGPMAVVAEARGVEAAVGAAAGTGSGTGMDVVEDGAGGKSAAGSTAGSKLTSGKEENGKEEGEEEPQPEIGYEMYQAFWELQRFFVKDRRLIESVEEWRNFYTYASNVMKLFQMKEYTDAELEQAYAQERKKQQQQQQRHPRNKEPRVNGGEEAIREDDSEVTYTGCKYLTSSDLFHLQLRDPSVRQQTGVQILYFLHYLQTKAKVMPDTASATPATAAAAAAAAPVLSPAMELLQSIAPEMLQLHDQACRLIERTPKHGTELLRVLKRLLSQEVRFICWKNQQPGCVPFQIDQATPAEAWSPEKKRKLDQLLDKESSNAFSTYRSRPGYGNNKNNSNSSSGITKANKSSTASLLAGYEFDHSDAHVKEVAKQLVQNIPTYEQEIEQYIDAEDPDCGIEEEYHPKHDNLYCWRTRRLLAAKQLFALEAMSDGDISKGLSKIKNPHDNANGGGGNDDADDDGIAESKMDECVQDDGEERVEVQEEKGNQKLAGEEEPEPLEKESVVDCSTAAEEGEEIE